MMLLKLSLYITTTLFGLVFLLQSIPLNFDFLDPIQQALEDFQVTDIVFKNFKEEFQDTNIVFVNIGFLNRAEVAKQLQNVARFEPKVIGIDALFEGPREPELDSALSRVLQQYGHKIVMVNAFEKYNPQTQKADSIAFSMPYFSRFVHQGYANLDDRSFRTIRNFRPFTIAKDTLLTAFSLEIIKLFNIQKFHSFKKRNQPFETINYRGDFEKFYSVIEADRALDSTADLSFVKNKIVLFGYLNSDKNATDDITDKFYTPLNPKMAGHSLPDMYGIVIHANIISMILSEDYIHTMTPTTAVIWALIFCFLYLWFLLYIYHHKNHYFDIIARTSQIILSLFLYYLIIWLFDSFRYETDMVLTLISLALAPDVLELFMAFYEARKNKT